MGESIRKGLFWLLVVGVVLRSGNPAFGYSTKTHKDINEAIFNHSGLVGYFDNELRISIAGSQTFQGKIALNLFRDAGEAEDATIGLPPFRYINHYDDPLMDWENAGYSYGPLSGKASVLWAQDLSQDLTGSNHWTWQRAYSYFLSGLTASDNVTRDRSIANLFTTLGHLTHLTADISVPLHTRNDSHALAAFGFYRTYETWCEENLLDLSSTAMGELAYRYAFAPSDVIFAESQANSAGMGTYSPVSNLWDSFVDVGYNSRLWQSGTLAGLAEYSNANFLSRGTVFNKYAYPNWNETVGFQLESIPAKDGQTDVVVYFKRWTTDNSALVSHLAAVDLLYQEWSSLPDDRKTLVPAHLDNTCYEEYASNLVPRAVSYGTKLVDYFFRGKIDVEPEGDTLHLTNRSRGKLSGSITVYRDDPSDGLRKPVEGLVDITVELPPGETFSRGIAPYPPPSSMNDQYTLVFRGDMENLDAFRHAANRDFLVAGKVFKLVDKEYPFLVDPNGSILVFDLAVNDGHYVLTPTSKTIDMTMENNSFGMTIQSDPSETHHYAALGGSSDMRDEIRQYGVNMYAYTDVLGHVYYLSHGSPYSYRPADFTKGSPYFLDHNGLLYDGMGDPQTGQVFATGRQNYTLDSEGKMVSHHNSVWRRVNSQGKYEYFFRYKTDNSDLLSGPWTDGPVLEPNLTPIAVIEKETVLGTLLDGAESPILLKVGDHIIDESEIWHQEAGWTPELLKEGEYNWQDPGICIKYGLGVFRKGVLYTFSSDATTPAIKVYDYDSVDEGRILTCIIEKSSVVYTGDQEYFYDDNCNSPLNYDYTQNYNIDYYLYFRLDGGEGSILLGRGSRDITSWPYQDSGEKVTAASIKIGDRFIAYTYVLETPQSGKWTFQKRMLGIINLSDPQLPPGYRQEFELDVSGLNFDPRWVAVGITK